MAREILGVAGAAVGFAFGGPAGAQVGFAVGSVVGGLIDPLQIDGPKLGDAAVQTSRDGIPIPVGWGIFHVAGNLIAMTPFVVTTVKSGSKKTGETHTERRSRTFAIGIGRGRVGPIGGIQRVWENNKLVYDARPTATLPAADSAEFLEGVTIYTGTETQLSDPELESNFGVGTTPAYRGLPYIVFNNKDLTDFASSIPLYRFEIWGNGFVATTSSGIASTDNGWSAGVNHAHPFEGEEWSEFTKSIVFKSDTAPLFAVDKTTFALAGKSVWLSKNGSGHFWIQHIVTSYPASGNEHICTSGIRLGIASPNTINWSPTDWYCVTTSYSQPLNASTTVYTNLSRGEEVVVADTILNNNVVSFVNTGFGEPGSTIAWGCLLINSNNPREPSQPWDGWLSHAFIEDQYIDLTQESGRRLFSGLSSVNSLGADGDVPFGSVPRIYLPDGHPHNNRGTADIGTWSDDFFYQGELQVNGSPPPASTIDIVNVTEDDYPTVGGIVRDLCTMVDVTDVDTTEVDSILCRGIMTAGMYSSADTIRALQRAYFFDMPEIDGDLVAVLRGGDVVATIMRSDMVLGQEAEFETAREQGVEFPNKLRIAYTNSESDYTPTAQTSERRSGDVKALTETSIEVPINLTDDEAAQVADKMHKMAWAEFEGTAKMGLPEKWAKLVPSDPVSVELRSGVMKRVRLLESSFVDGVFQFEAVSDRVSTIDSSVVAPPVVTPETPDSNLPSETTFTVMDIPLTPQSSDTLHLHIAATGDGTNTWAGAVVDQLIETEWVRIGDVVFPSTIGTLLEPLPIHSPGTDTTNTVLVSLSDDAIATITQEEFDLGGNPALINDEIVYIKTVTAEGDNWRLSYLNRASLTTASETHAIGDKITFLDGAKRFIQPTEAIGDYLTLRVYSVGETPTIDHVAGLTFTGKSQIEWAPQNLTATLDGNGDWSIDWDHTKRVGAPNDAVISRHFVEFAIELTSGVTTQTVYFPTDDITYTDAEQLVDFSGAVSEFDQIKVWGINEYTGAGGIASISTEHLLLEGGDALLLESGDELTLEI